MNSFSPVPILRLQLPGSTSPPAFAPTLSYRPISLPPFDQKLGKRSFRISFAMSSFAFPLWLHSPCARAKQTSLQVVSRRWIASNRSSTCWSRDSPRKDLESWKSFGMVSSSRGPRHRRVTTKNSRIKTNPKVYSGLVSSLRLLQTCFVRMGATQTTLRFRFSVARYGKKRMREIGRERLGISFINLLHAQVSHLSLLPFCCRADISRPSGCVLIATHSLETWTRNRRLAALGHYPAWMSSTEALSGTADKIFRLSGIILCSSNSSQSGQKVKRVESKEKAPKGRGSKGKKVVFVEEWERPWLYIKLVSSRL